MLNHPYYPMQDNTYIDYAIYNITGWWHDDIFGLDVLTREFVKVQRTSFSVMTSPMFGYLPFYAGYQHALITPNQPVDFTQTLIDGIGCIGDNYYIGEAISNFDRVHVPPIAKLEYNPVTGSSIDKVSQIYASQTDKTVVVNFHWKYKTVNHYDEWGAFTDVWRTGLREYHSEHTATVPDAVYNYCFQRGVGLVDLWHGQFQPDGTVIGNEYYFVGKG